MEILRERIFKIENDTLFYNARFWIPSEKYTFKLKCEMEAKFIELNNDYKLGDCEAIADYFCEKYPINAVEITTKQGTGVVHYLNWP